MQSLTQHGELQAVDDKAVDVLDDHGAFPKRGNECAHFFDCFRGGFFADDYLAEREQMRRVEPVLPYKAGGKLHGFCNVRNVQTGGVCGKERAVRHKL